MTAGILLILLAALCLFSSLSALFFSRMEEKSWGYYLEANKDWKETYHVLCQAYSLLKKHAAYEAALRRKLATLRARKQVSTPFLGREHLDEFSGRMADKYFCGRALGINPTAAHHRDGCEENITRWRKDWTEGNWAKYLLREKEAQGR